MGDQGMSGSQFAVMLMGYALFFFMMVVLTGCGATPSGGAYHVPGSTESGFSAYCAAHPGTGTCP